MAFVLVQTRRLIKCRKCVVAYKKELLCWCYKLTRKWVARGRAWESGRYTVPKKSDYRSGFPGLVSEQTLSPRNGCRMSKLPQMSFNFASTQRSIGNVTGHVTWLVAFWRSTDWHLDSSLVTAAATKHTVSHPTCTKPAIPLIGSLPSTLALHVLYNQSTYLPCTSAPEDGDSMFLRNVDTYLQIHTAPKSKTSTTNQSQSKLENAHCHVFHNPSYCLISKYINIKIH